MKLNVAGDLCVIFHSTALDNHLAIAILRTKDGLDVSDIYGHTDLIAKGAIPSPNGNTSSNGAFTNSSFETSLSDPCLETSAAVTPKSAKRNAPKPLCRTNSEKQFEASGIENSIGVYR